MGVSAAYSFIQTTNGYIGLSSFEQRMITKVDRFTATNASYVVPAGVTYMIAYITAGGGGAGTSGAGDGGTSSAAFAGGTVSATGGAAMNQNVTPFIQTIAGAVNSGEGAFYCAGNASSVNTIGGKAGNGAEIVAGGAVTPAATITVTVGAGGTAGVSGSVGGSGYVYLEYQVKA